ncbi:MAG: sugar ABC transporter ATP-binding protein [Phycisphaerales bacterium]|nr:sugar ABC transporter ATP-binding protein [Phycisphaerales bacterium]
MVETPPRLRFTDVRKRFGGVVALDGVSFEVCPGVVHAIVGENGAGKSTLMNILGGSLRPDGGQLHLDGQVLEPRSARQAQQLGIAVVHQELSIAPDLSVAENVFLGRWPHRRGSGLVQKRALESAAQALLARLRTPLSPGVRAGELNVANQQMIEIARALSMDARVLVLDEPSAVLTPIEVERLFAIVRELTARGVSVLYISHRLEEVFELAQAVTVLRDGKHVSTRSITDTDRETLIREAVGRSVATHRPAARTPGDIALRVESLSAPGRFADVSFEVRRGEVLCLAGLVGSGRSSVARAVFGALPGVRGLVQVGPMHGPFRSPRDAQRAGVAFIPEDRKGEGVLLERSVRENLLLAHRHAATHRGLVRQRHEREVARELLREHAIRAASSEVAAATLSGGNQQKVLLARWLMRDYPVCIFDEPTRGVDVGAKAEIHAMIDAIAARGGAVVVVSSELPEVLALGDRIAVMRRGRLVATLSNMERSVTQEEVMRLAVGGVEAMP